VQWTRTASLCSPLTPTVRPRLAPRQSRGHRPTPTASAHRRRPVRTEDRMHSTRATHPQGRDPRHSRRPFAANPPDHSRPRRVTSPQAKTENEHATNVPAPASRSGPRFRGFTPTPPVPSTHSPRELHGGSPAPPAGPPQGRRPGVHQPPGQTAAGSNPACSGLAQLRCARH
jgi:hypothetical protein